MHKHDFGGEANPRDCECGVRDMTLRERCEKLADEIYHAGPNLHWEEHFKRIEAFAREIRNETLEEAAQQFDHPEAHTVSAHVAAAIRKLKHAEQEE